MKALKSHPQIEQPCRINNRINLATHTAGLVLALVGLISVALMNGPIQLASADTVALGWSYTGRLNTPRSSHRATLSPAGKVLVAGGPNISGYLDSAELYDSATGKWNPTGSLNVSQLHTATNVTHTLGRIYGQNLQTASTWRGLPDSRNLSRMRRFAV